MIDLSRAGHLGSSCSATAVTALRFVKDINWRDLDRGGSRCTPDVEVAACPRRSLWAPALLASRHLTGRSHSPTHAARSLLRQPPRQTALRAGVFGASTGYYAPDTIAILPEIVHHASGIAVSLSPHGRTEPVRRFAMSSAPATGGRAPTHPLTLKKGRLFHRPMGRGGSQ
jgi:hypothetical protein